MINVGPQAKDVARTQFRMHPRYYIIRATANNTTAQKEQ